MKMISKEVLQTVLYVDYEKTKPVFDNPETKNPQTIGDFLRMTAENPDQDERKKWDLKTLKSMMKIVEGILESKEKGNDFILEDSEWEFLSNKIENANIRNPYVALELLGVKDKVKDYKIQP